MSSPGDTHRANPTAGTPLSAEAPAPAERVQPSSLTAPLGQTFLDRLKAAVPGTTDESLIMDTFHSVPADQLKAALGAATPKERAQIFAALPRDQVGAVLRSLPVSVLVPTGPPPPPPAPTGGPPASILQTTYENVSYPPAESDPDWTDKFSNGSTIGLTSPPPWEWVSVYDQSFEKEGSLNNPMVGVTGWIAEASLSNGDVWFVHPFGFDFEYYIAPDPQYENLLGNSNTGVKPSTGAVDSDYQGATTAARNLGLPAPKGVLGVETDQDLVPQAFRDLITPGSRIATFGRWIVDCGHDDFHTEIHAPLLMAVAKPAPPPAGVRGASQMTSLHLMSRPYTVSQKFSEGNFIDHLLAEVGKVETTILGIPMSTRVEAHPTVFTTPYDGRPFIKLLVQPPPLPHRGPVGVGQVGGILTQHLMVNFHFTHRTGVAVRVYDAGNGTVGIMIVLGDLNPAKLPPKHDLTVQWSQLGSEYSYVIDALQIADILTLDIAPAIILNRGILTDRYDPPSASSLLDNQNVAGPVAIDQLALSAGLSEDDGQPFPIYGWLNTWWQEGDPVVLRA
jgi:hypothetical protein